MAPGVGPAAADDVTPVLVYVLIQVLLVVFAQLFH